MITTFSYDEIFLIWQKYLWPNRISTIEQHSAMLFLTGHDLKNYDYEPTFFCFIKNDAIAGVNSGHKCCDGSYRSRGLYVFPEYRNQGIGTKLLIAASNQGSSEQCKFVWSYPRFESWKTYERAGFSLSSDWLESEMGINAFCRREL